MASKIVLRGHILTTSVEYSLAFTGAFGANKWGKQLVSD